MAKQTWVYLMRDMRSEFYKIGFSNNPSYREKTLQAEQPLILLVDSWEGSQQDEKTLHKMFAAVKVRGEWFGLKKDHLTQIYRYFYDRSNLRAVQELKEAKAKIYNLERDVCLWKSRFEFLDRQAKAEKAKLDAPEFEMPPIVKVEIPARRSLLESARLSRLPSLPKRNSFISLPVRRVDGQIIDDNAQSQIPGVVIRLNDHPSQPKVEYIDEVPF